MTTTRTEAHALTIYDPTLGTVRLATAEETAKFIEASKDAASRRMEIAAAAGMFAKEYPAF